MTNHNKRTRAIPKQGDFFDMNPKAQLIYYYFLGQAVTDKFYENGNYVRLKVTKSQIGSLESLCNTWRNGEKKNGPLNMDRKTYRKNIDILTSPIEFNTNGKTVKKPLLKHMVDDEKDPRYWTDFYITNLKDVPPFTLVSQDILALLTEFKNPYIIHTYAGLLSLSLLEIKKGPNPQEIENLSKAGVTYENGDLITCATNILKDGVKFLSINKKDIKKVNEALQILDSCSLINIKAEIGIIAEEDGKKKKTKGYRIVINNIKQSLQKNTKEYIINATNE